MTNLYQKLASVRKIADVVQKTQSGYNYSYASITEILAKVSAGMNKTGISLIPRYEQENVIVEPYTYKKTKFSRTGQVIEEVINEYIAKAPITYTWVDNETGERLDVPWFIAGSQSDPSQALGSAMTYGLRQFLTQFFQIAQPQDDPDNWRSQQKEAEQSEAREVAKAIIDQVHAMVNAYITEHEGDRAKITAIVKKYAKEKNKPSANYFAITDPDTASKLLNELNEFCGNKKGGDKDDAKT